MWYIVIIFFIICIQPCCEFSAYFNRKALLNGKSIFNLFFFSYNSYNFGTKVGFEFGRNSQGNNEKKKKMKLENGIYCWSYCSYSKTVVISTHHLLLKTCYMVKISCFSWFKLFMFDTSVYLKCAFISLKLVTWHQNVP